MNGIVLSNGQLFADREPLVMLKDGDTETTMDTGTITTPAGELDVVDVMSATVVQLYP